MKPLPDSALHRLRAPIAWLLCAFALLAAPSGRAELVNYKLDPVHTRVLFRISHAGFSSQPGFFTAVKGQLKFDAADWSQSQLEVHIPIASLQLGDADWNRHILDHTFFEVKKFPEALFVSTQVKQDSEARGIVTGNLTLHGVTRPVTLAVALNALKRHPLTRRRTVGFSATGVISRKDFGIDAWSSMVGDEVTLQIECEALRSGEDDAAAR